MQLTGLATIVSATLCAFCAMLMLDVFNAWKEGGKHSSKKKLVVVAQGRSGSSFISSWFGAHPSCLYLLEPCAGTYAKKVGGADKTGSKCGKLSGQLLNCDFRGVDVNRDQKPYIPSNVRGFKGWGHQSKERMQTCKEQALIALKEIRMGTAFAHHVGHASLFFGKVRDDNLKVLVLVRDPRAVFSSRISDWPVPEASGSANDFALNPRGYIPGAKTGFPYYQSLRSLCFEHLSLRKKASSNDPSIMLVRYEEMLRNPMQLLVRIFNFLEMPLANEVVEHVRKNMNGDCEHVDSAFSVCRKMEIDESRLDDKWRTKLSQESLQQLLDIAECREVIENFYK